LQEIHWVAGEWVLVDDDGVALKKSVGLMARQEFEVGGVEMYSFPLCHFVGVLKGDTVGECKFAKSYQCKETNA